VRRRSLASATSIAGALALASAAAASNGGVAPVTPVSPNGQRITDAYWVILAITGAVFVVVEGLLLAFVIRYRRRGRPRYQEGDQVAGERNVEITWTAAPVVLLAAIVGFVFYKLPGIKDTPSASASGGRLEITVEGHQFYWLFRYPDGRESINTLFVPANRVVSLRVVSGDVVHSWWVPAFGGKTDAIPGKTNHTWFQAKRAGVYPIRCAEFCGAQHALMDGSVHVGGGGPPPAAGLGKQAFEGVCASCHGLQGQGLIGPAIATSPTLQDPKALGALVHNGIGTMPAVGNTWDAKLTNALASYLQKRFGGAGGG
jgi:cytochrome c oxidase subunit 2